MDYQLTLEGVIPVYVHRLMVTPHGFEVKCGLVLNQAGLLMTQDSHYINCPGCVQEGMNERTY